MSNLKELIEIVRVSRCGTKGVFPLPDGNGCIDYAITEGGETVKAFRDMCIDAALFNATEYLDAVLRQNRSGDKRNNDRNHTPRKEWGQCGYMIASAIIQVPNIDSYDNDDFEAYESPDNTTLYQVIAFLCNVRDDVTGRDTPELDALDFWHAFAVKCGWNPADLLSETCADFERKHLRAPFVYPVLSAEQAAAQGEVVGGV